MTANCPKCNKQHNSEHINTELGIITCTQCQTVFSAPYFFEPSNPKKAEKETVPLPENFTKVTNLNYLQIKIPKSGCITNILFFSLMSLVIIIFFGLIPLANYLTIWMDADIAQGIVFSCLFFPIVFIIWILSYGINTSRIDICRIELSQSNLTVKHRSQTSPFHLIIPLDTIQQIYTKETFNAGYVSSSSSSLSTPSYLSYDVFAIHTDDKESLLVGNLKRHNEALYIEQEIESYLGLRDQAVEGEFR